MKSKINKSQKKITIFLWDIHDVILEKHWGKIFLQALKYNQKWQLITHLKPRLFWDLNKFAWYHLFKGSCTDEFLYLIKKNNNPYLAKCFKICVNYQQPIKGTIQIIRELSDLGYTHYVGSNIGHNTFQALIDKNENPHVEHIFSHFNLVSPQVVPYDPLRPKGLIRKPNPQFFHSFLERNNINLDECNVIFIDNNKKNIKIARSLGFIGIHFKTPDQLRKDLHKIARISLPNAPLKEKT